MGHKMGCYSIANKIISYNICRSSTNTHIVLARVEFDNEESRDLACSI